MVKHKGRGGRRSGVNEIVDDDPLGVNDDGFDQGGSTGRSRVVDYDPDAPSIHNDPATSYGRSKKNKADGVDRKTVRDTRRGRAADDYQVGVDGDGSHKNLGHNKVIDGKDLAQGLLKIRADEASIKKIMDDARKKCEPLRKAIKTTKKSLVESGAHSDELNVLIRKDKLQQKLANITEKLDDDQKAHFKTLEAALGDFMTTGLGAAAAAAEARAAHH